MQHLAETETSPPDATTYGFWTSAFWAVAATAVAAAVAVAMAFVLPRLKLPDVLADQIVLAVTSVIITGVVLAAILWRRAPLTRYLALETLRPGWALIAVGGLIAIQSGGSWIGDYFGIGTADAAWELTEYKKLLASNAAMILALINVPLLAPLTEEVLFRGFLYRGWAASRLGPPGTIVLTSLLFGALHVQYSWHGVAIVTALGLWFGVVRWRSGSLAPSLIAHCAGNAMVTLGTVFTATAS